MTGVTLQTPLPLSSEHGTCEKVKARRWTWLPGKSPQIFKGVLFSFGSGKQNGFRRMGDSGIHFVVQGLGETCRKAEVEEGSEFISQNVLIIWF